MPTLKTSCALLLALVLPACGGGGGDPPAGQPLTVAPSLGMVQVALVQVSDLSNVMIGLGALGSAGSVSLSLPAGNRGFIVELQGGSGVYYFDEALGTTRPLPAGRTLHAVSAEPRGSVTVTALTELAYRRALSLAAGSPLTPAVITAAEDSVRTLLGLGADDDLLAPPELVDDPLDLPTASTWAGRQARLLAAWSQLALERRLLTQPDCRSDSTCSPLLDLIDDVALDLADGTLDGMATGAALESPFYSAAGGADAFRAALDSAATTVADRIAAVRAAVPDTDELIGQRLAGSYALTCQQTLPSPALYAVPMTVTVAGDGGFTVKGPFGTVPLPAGNSVSAVSENATIMTILRAGLYVPAGSASLPSGAPVADGLSISLNPVVTPIQLQSSQLAEVKLSTEGPSTITVHTDKWSCSGFVPKPLPADASATLSAARDSYRAWLPDGVYRCELGGVPDQPRYLQASAGVLTSTSAGGVVTDNNLVPAPGLALSGLTIAWERRDYAIASYPVLPVSHTHSDDDVAATAGPLVQFGLAEEAVDRPRSVWFYRSLVTGKGYFNLLLGINVLAHCQAYVEPPPPPPPPECWGSSAFC